MIPLIVGISSGLLVILIFVLVNRLDKQIVYGLILSGIGFLYVGFTWSDTIALMMNGAQAVFFVLFAGYGIRKGPNILAAGYFLHGIWDLIYNLFPGSNLIPPHYDLFCLSFDFTIGFHLLYIKYGNIRGILRS